MSTHKEIVFVGGEKGGVGKSFVVRTLAVFLHEQGLPMTVFECDRTNPDVFRTFTGKLDTKYAVFSEGRQFQDAAIDILRTGAERLALVNLPAQVQSAFSVWLNKNGVVQIAKRKGIGLRLFFVMDGSEESRKLAKTSLQQFGDHLKHVLICNQGKHMDWSFVLEDKELQALVAEKDASYLYFPEFYGETTIPKIDRHSLTFREAITFEHENWDPWKDIYRTENFLETAFERFMQAKLFPQLEIKTMVQSMSATAVQDQSPAIMQDQASAIAQEPTTAIVQDRQTVEAGEG